MTLPATVPDLAIDADWQWWRCRLVRKGPWVPARLWREEERDETGALLADVRYFAEVDGLPVDPFSPPSWPFWQAISEAEWRYLTETSRWAHAHAPDDPAANPRRRIDLNAIPTLF